jgi:hypothetical protein
LCCILSGCNWFGGFRPAEIIKHPDAPVLIAEVKGEYARGYVYDREKNELTDFGWFHLDNASAASWTLMKYDWEAIIKRRNEAKARGTGPR